MGTELNKGGVKKVSPWPWFLALIVIVAIGVTVITIVKSNEKPEEPEYEDWDDGIIVPFPDTSIKKPLIYLYPEQETDVTVELGQPDKISTSYPKYESGWRVKAAPNGDLVDLRSGRELYGLYWEGDSVGFGMTDEGFVVRGEDTAAFLEEKLAILGLTDREAEEFIVYWLPKMEKNKFNYIRFATKKEIEEYMPLKVTPTPDTTIRVAMGAKALDEPIEIKEQKLESGMRKGFTVVEWGGVDLGL